MMELYKETILGSIVIDLALFADSSISEFFSRYGDLFEKYTDMQKLQRLLEESFPVENWDIIQRAKNLADDTFFCQIFSPQRVLPPVPVPPHSDKERHYP